MALPKQTFTTGIGSLPHHNADAALAFSFKCSLPFLPQIPIRNPWEYMIAHALEGLPGLQVEEDGTATLNIDVWSGRSKTFNQKLMKAFENTKSLDAFESFEPSPATSSCWQPFLFELEERGSRVAKVQIAGPLSCQWSLKLSNGKHIDKHPDLAAQIYRLVLARGIAMGRRLRAGNISPVLYLDEPALYTFDATNPRHQLAWQEMKLMISALKKEEIVVGIHCCSNANWAQMMDLGIDIVSLDAALSLPAFLKEKTAIKEFVGRGGRISFGVLPTTLDTDLLKKMNADTVRGLASGPLFAAFKDDEKLAKQIMNEAIFTPACGLALHTTADVEYLLSLLVSLDS